MKIGILTFHFYFPDCQSLKDKRSRVKPILHQLHREFNVSIAEMDLLDMWKESVIVCVLIGNETAHIQRSLQRVYNFAEKKWPENIILDHKIELV
ncbi:MAG: DUF503 domain-containing protein [Anaerolineaceae bacterium]|nr:DUF503 domain-containing protein [Anaerolineaceae bacterium]